MTEFLRQVADHYLETENARIGSCCFVFPNRRSQIFFRRYLGEGVKRKGEPIVAPKMLTINDFFASVPGGVLADRVDLLLELHNCYSALTKNGDALDEFIFWGDVLLADFDDVDKYLVDPEQLFRNVSDFRDIQDSYSYLTDSQRKAVEQFAGHFWKQGKLAVALDAETPNVKEKFLRTWNLLLPLYRGFRGALEEKGLAYEGLLYRRLAERMQREAAADVMTAAFPGIHKYIFTGLNALNECEKTVLRKLRDASLAEFCWDYSSRMIRHPLNKSSLFLSRNVQEFRQSFELDPEGLASPEVEVISLPSSAGQAKLLPEILQDDACAIVLPDERLLLPVLNSIPPAVKDINVTMGYPMGAGAFFDFLMLVNAMQLHLRRTGREWSFYHSQVWSLFSSSLLRKVLEGEEGAAEKVKAVKEGKKYYIPRSELSGTPVFDLLFRPVVTDPKAASAEQVKAFCSYLKELITGIAVRLGEDPDMALELEFAKIAYAAVNRLADKKLTILPLTFTRLLDQLLRPLSVPFNGEPLKGLQIMGPLETRALDFRHVVILSCNEGIFPHRSVQSSFIPPELRKGFGLPTAEFQDAVWAYYFYRMIQRAEKVSLVYDSRTEGLQTGEESRYIKQLEYHFRLPLTRRFGKAGARTNAGRPDIPKSEDDVRKLAEINFSASALENYLDCPAMFYYSKIAGLEEAEEVAEDLDTGMLGSIYHATMQALYMGDKAMDPDFDPSDRRATGRFADPLEEVTRDYLDRWMKCKPEIKARVRSLIKTELHAPEVSGRNLVLENVIVQYVLKTLQRDRELLEREGLERFRIVSLEKFFRMEFHGYSFVGFIDRMDSLRPWELRIVDYKTGRVKDKDVDIRDDNAEQVADLLFGPENQGRPKIAFQLFLYDLLVGQEPAYREWTLYNSIYQPVKLFTEPVLTMPVSRKFNEIVETRLHTLLDEISDVGTPWRRTEDLKTCSWCPFKMICGR